MHFGDKIYLQNEMQVQTKYVLNSFSFINCLRFDRMKTHTHIRTHHIIFTVYHRFS